MEDENRRIMKDGQNTKGTCHPENWEPGTPNPNRRPGDGDSMTRGVHEHKMHTALPTELTATKKKGQQGRVNGPGICESSEPAEQKNDNAELEREEDTDTGKVAKPPLPLNLRNS